MQRKRSSLTPLNLDDNISQKKSRNNGSYDPKFTKRAGTISRIMLKNFMCHNALEINFKSNINFITGQNGSGKSAISMGLIIGLGAKASVTDRGTNIKNFIKQGMKSASVEITLNNTGYMAYRLSTYGDEITIQRNFTLAGSSSYKIKSAAGVVVSTSVKEIQRITSAFNIQIDNPVCILNQDTARNFLSTSDPKQKFLLFVKATKLEELLDKYNQTRERKIFALQLYKEKLKMYNTLKEHLNELKKNIEDHQSIIKMKDNLTLCQIELMWAKVRDLETELNDQGKQVEKLQKKHEEINDNINNSIPNLQEIKNKLSELNQQMIEIKEAVEVESQSQLDVQKTINELVQKYNDKRREKHAAENMIKIRTKDLEALQKEIDNFTSNLTQIEQEKLKRLQETTTLQEQIKLIQNVMETTRNDLFQMETSDRRTEEPERNLQRELDQITNEQNNTRENLVALKRESDNNLHIYGRLMPEIVSVIKASKDKFVNLPRGPLGAYVNITDKKWAVAVESFLGAGLLHSFAVDNRTDYDILMEIFRKYQHQGWRQPTVIMTKFFFKIHDISKNLVHSPEDCISMFSVINIADPVVMNCIIDQTGIENVLLIPSTDRAIELMSNATQVPKNCRQGITIIGDSYYPDPDYKMYSSRIKQARYLQVSASDLISQYEARIQALQQKKRAVEDQHSALRKNRVEQEGKISETVSKLNKLKQAYFVAKQKLDDQNLLAEPEIVNVRSLEVELEEVKQLIDQKQVDVKQMESSMKVIKEAIAENEERSKKLQETNKAFENRVALLEKQIIQQGERKRELNVSDDFEKRRLTECAKLLREAHSDVQHKQRVIDEQTSEASMVGDKPEVIRQVPDVVNNINEMQRNIRRLEINVDRPEETRQKYEEVNTKYQQASQLMLALQNDVDDLDIGVTCREQHYKCTEDYFVTLLNHNFEKVMKLRQFKGCLNIDMERKKLDMIVIPQHCSQGHTATTNLSGGEKSFSTVAFLHSLWQCMDFPFYFLDEFDVFMDGVNRTMAMNILIHHAKSKPDLQFMFLTPQDISSVKDNSVIIHKLDDPDRRVLH